MAFVQVDKTVRKHERGGFQSPITAHDPKIPALVVAYVFCVYAAGLPFILLGMAS